MEPEETDERDLQLTKAPKSKKVEIQNTLQQETEGTIFSEKETTFDLRHLAGGELSAEEIDDLKDFALVGGYSAEAVILGGVNKDVLDCVPDRDGARVVNTLTRIIGFPKLEHELSGLRKQHIVGSLAFTSIKVRLRLHNMLSELNVELTKSFYFLKNAESVVKQGV